MFNLLIIENFSDPQYAGRLENADLVLELGNALCGDRIRVELKLAGQVVQRARYQAWGCATSLAAGNIFCAHIESKRVEDVIATPSEVIATMLGELAPAQQHCLHMLSALFAQVRSRHIDMQGGG